MNCAPASKAWRCKLRNVQLTIGSEQIILGRLILRLESLASETVAFSSPPTSTSATSQDQSGARHRTETTALRMR